MYYNDEWLEEVYSEHDDSMIELILDYNNESVVKR